MSDMVSSELHEYTYEGFWRKCSEPAFKQLVLTIRDSIDLIILACVAIVLGFTQSRAWAIYRYAILQCNKSVRLPDDRHPEPLEQL